MLISDKQNQDTLKYMMLVARDILAIPGIGISVEHLFSSLNTPCLRSVIHDRGNGLGRHCDQGMAEDRVGRGRKLHGFHQDQGSVEYIQIYSKYIHIHFPRYDMICYRYDMA